MIEREGPLSQAEVLAQEHRVRIRVRYAESDQMGYAHHSAYVVWIEQGRVDWLRAAGLSYRELEAQGILMPVVELKLKYRLPARFEDELILGTRLTALGRCRIEFVTRIENERGELVAEGSVVLATVNRQGRPIPLPEALHTALRNRLTSRGAEHI